MPLRPNEQAREVAVRIITASKLRNDAKEAERRMGDMRELTTPRQYARLIPHAVQAAKAIGLAKLVKRSGLSRTTIMEILAP